MLCFTTLPCPPQGLYSNTVHYASPNAEHWKAVCLRLCRDERIQLSWILSLATFHLFHSPYLFFPFSLPMGKLLIADNSYFALNFGNLVKGFYVESWWYFLVILPCGCHFFVEEKKTFWLEKKLILVFMFLVIWSPKNLKISQRWGNKESSNSIIILQVFT